jgi:hypothetical protein
VATLRAGFLVRFAKLLQLGLHVCHLSLQLNTLLGCCGALLIRELLPDQPQLHMHLCQLHFLLAVFTLLQAQCTSRWEDGSW